MHTLQNTQTTAMMCALPLQMFWLGALRSCIPVRLTGANVLACGAVQLHSFSFDRTLACVMRCNDCSAALQSRVIMFGTGIRPMCKRIINSICVVYANTALEYACRAAASAHHQVRANKPQHSTMAVQHRGLLIMLHQLQTQLQAASSHSSCPWE